MKKDAVPGNPDVPIRPEALPSSNFIGGTDGSSQRMDHLVSTGLSLALGPNIARESEAFSKMRDAVRKKIMSNPEYRMKLEKYISILEKFNQT